MSHFRLEPEISWILKYCICLQKRTVTLIMDEFLFTIQLILLIVVIMLYV